MVYALQIDLKVPRKDGQFIHRCIIINRPKIQQIFLNNKFCAINKISGSAFFSQNVGSVALCAILRALEGIIFPGMLSACSTIVPGFLVSRGISRTNRGGYRLENKELTVLHRKSEAIAKNAAM